VEITSRDGNTRAPINDEEPIYTDQQATVHTEFGNTSAFGIGKGVRQGCILLPCLFNLYAERNMRMSNLDELNAGIRIGGGQLNNLRYAVDTTFMAGERADLQESSNE